MGKAIKFIYPFAFSLACVLSYFLFFRIILKYAVNFNAVIGLILGIIIEFGLIIYVFLLAVPCHCFIYGKKVLADAKRKHLFALYNSLVLAVFCFAVFSSSEHKYVYTALLFFWAEIWCTVPILFIKKG